MHVLFQTSWVGCIAHFLTCGKNNSADDNACARRCVSNYRLLDVGDVGASRRGMRVESWLVISMDGDIDCDSGELGIGETLCRPGDRIFAGDERDF